MTNVQTDPTTPTSADLAYSQTAEPVRVVDDPYSDRVRCDHPACDDGVALGHALRDFAEDSGRGRVVALVPAPIAPDLAKSGYEVDGIMPGFYQGEVDCAVMGLATDPARQAPAHPIEAQAVDELLLARPAPRPRAAVPTQRATPDDATEVARLIERTFDEYPTPSSDPAYVRAQIEDGIPFRLVRDGGEVVACASADLVRAAESAELTDCATRPDHRGRGYMQFILSDLIGDTRRLGYPTVFTLARARVPGVNLAFQRLGFDWRGRMNQSCRIGDGIEDMNIWSRPTVRS